MKKNPDLSIVIASFNTKELTRACLVSLFKAKKPAQQWEIIVVDNASSDGTPQMISQEFPMVIFEAQKQNTGFASANNRGIRLTKAPYILLLNSDTEVGPDTIDQTLSFLKDHTDVGVVTCKLVLPSGKLDPASHRGFPTPWASLTYFIGLERLFPSSSLFAQYHQGYKDLTSIHEIDSPSGAFFLFRREIIDSVGILDEQFYMYGEDLDWAYRIKQYQWKIYFYPWVTALHRKNQSGRKSEDVALQKQTTRYFYDTMKLFYQKHYRHVYGWLVTQLILLGITIRSKL